MSGPQQYPGNDPLNGPPANPAPQYPAPGSYPPPGQYQQPGQPGAFPPPPPVDPYGQGGYGQPIYGGAGAPADAGIRLVARIIDGIIVAIPTFIISLAAGAGAYASGSSVSLGLLIVLTLVLAVAASAYYVLMEAKLGGTVGKKILNLRVVGPSGGNPTVSQAALRFLPLFIASLVTGVLGIFGYVVTIVVYIALGVTISQSASKQGFHDNMAGGTQVIKTT